MMLEAWKWVGHCFQLLWEIQLLLCKEKPSGKPVQPQNMKRFYVDGHIES